MQRSTRIRVAAVIATVAMVASVATPAFAATLTIDGSTTLLPLAQKWASVYKAAHGWSITVTGGGSGKGISDVKSGNKNIGMSSRAKAAADGDTTIFTPVARDALVIVVNAKLYKKYPKYIYRLSTAQVQKIYRGQITKWKQINSHLPNHAIDLAGRTGSSGTYTYFQQMFLSDYPNTGRPITQASAYKYKQSARTRTYASNGSVRSSVAGDMYGIGYLSQAYVNSSVHALNMQTPTYWYDANYTPHKSSSPGKWIVPSLKTALNGTYKYVRPLYFVTVGAPSGDAATFINWCLSSAGQAYCQGQHYLKLH